MQNDIEKPLLNHSVGFSVILHTVAALPAPMALATLGELIVRNRACSTQGDERELSRLSGREGRGGGCGVTHGGSMADVEDSAGSESEEEDELEKKGSRKLTNDSLVRACICRWKFSGGGFNRSVAISEKQEKALKEVAWERKEGMAPFSHVLISGAPSAKFKH